MKISIALFTALIATATAAGTGSQRGLGHTKLDIQSGSNLLNNLDIMLSREQRRAEHVQTQLATP